MKKLLQFSLYLFIFSVMDTNAQVTNGLIGYYSFNGNADDNSPSGNDGTVFGATLTTDKRGNANSAYNFDGSSYIDLNHVYDNQNRSVSVWFNATTVSVSHIIYSSDNKNMNYGMTAIYLKNVNGQSKLMWNINNVLDTSDITLNSWHNVVVTVSSSIAKVYLDCNLLGTYSVSGNTRSTDLASNDKVGTSRANNQFFIGKIDELRLYNRSLTSAEIDTLCGVFNSSISEISKEPGISFDIFPNPNSGVFNFKISGEITYDGYSYSIFNELGQKIETGWITGESTEIDLSQQPKGLYIITVFDPKDLIVGNQKIIIQ